VNGTFRRLSPGILPCAMKKEILERSRYLGACSPADSHLGVCGVLYQSTSVSGDGEGCDLLSTMEIWY
jgi:hypothetical protein